MYSAFGVPHGWHTIRVRARNPAAPYGIRRWQAKAKFQNKGFARMACRTSKIEPTPIQPRLLAVKAAAAYMGATVWAIRQLAWNRELPFCKIGGRLLFDRADLDHYIDMQKGVA
jgi:excisionase family DNA binding protein